MKKSTPQERKEKAIELLKQLEIYKPYIEGFENDGNVCFYENFGGYWVYQEPEIEAKMREIEKEYNCTVYAITHEYSSIGECYDFLLIPNFPEEWDELVSNSRRNEFYAFAYVWNKTDDWCSEFGTIVVESFGGGIKRIAQFTEKFVPFMACAYILGALIVFLVNIGKIGEVFGAIFTFAFGFRAVGGAAVGLAVRSAVTWGFKRGVFSNEAGLGSSVMVHSASNVVEPVRQGMWGIFEVFADTIVVCTLTAFSILSTGLIDLQTGEMLSANEQTALVSEAFGTVF